MHDPDDLSAGLPSGQSALRGAQEGTLQVRRCMEGPSPAGGQGEGLTTQFEFVGKPRHPSLGNGCAEHDAGWAAAATSRPNLCERRPPAHQRCPRFVPTPPGHFSPNIVTFAAFSTSALSAEPAASDRRTSDRSDLGYVRAKVEGLRCSEAAQVISNTARPDAPEGL